MFFGRLIWIRAKEMTLSFSKSDFMFILTCIDNVIYCMGGSSFSVAIYRGRNPQRKMGGQCPYTYKTNSRTNFHFLWEPSPPPQHTQRHTPSFNCLRGGDEVCLFLKGEKTNGIKTTLPLFINVILKDDPPPQHTHHFSETYLRPCF